MIQDLFRLQGTYQGLVRATFSGVFEDLRFKRGNAQKGLLAHLAALFLLFLVFEFFFFGPWKL